MPETKPHGHLAAILDGLPDATFVIDTQGIVTAWNHAIERISGVKAEAMVGRGNYEYALALYGERRPILVDQALLPRPELLASHLELRERGDVLLGQGLVLERERTRWFEDNAVLLRDAEGTVIGAIETIYDVTERKHLETEMETSRRRLSNIVDAMPDAVFVIDDEGKIIAWNKATVAMTGAAADQMLGKGNFEYSIPFYGGERRPVLIDFLKAPDDEIAQKYLVRHEGDVLTGEVKLLVRGRPMYAHARACALYDETGNIAGGIEIVRDLTEHNRLMEELAAAKAAAEEAKNFVRQVFGRYLSDDVVANLLETPEGLALGGESREVSVMMADLRGFSSLAEHLAPTEVIKLLNKFLGTMAEIVAKHGGTVDEFIGDAILAIFGAPKRHEDHARRAVACAVEMQLAIAEVNAFTASEGLPMVEMGIGLNTGEVVVGNIGSEQRSKYGVVGRHVNLASRIESYTVGGQILVSDSTLGAAGSNIRVDGVMEVFPKGSVKPMRVHQIGGIGGEYGLDLPRQDSNLSRLEQPLEIWFSVLDGKNVTAPDHQGSITHLSPRQARIASALPVELMAVVKFDLSGSQSGPTHIYAKVLSSGDDGRDLLVHFTSVAPGAAQTVSSLVGVE